MNYKIEIVKEAKSDYRESLIGTKIFIQI